MYLARYNGNLLYNPRHEGLQATEATLSLTANESGQATLGIPPSNPLYGSFELMSATHEITIEEDGEELFRGRIRSYEKDKNNCEILSCEGQLSYLNDTVVRPYGTYENPEEWKRVAPSERRELWGWLVAQHNSQADADKYFYCGENECGDGKIKTSSTSYPTCGAEIKEKLVDPGYGYVQSRFIDGMRYVDFIGAEDRRNGQRIEFGVNLVDFTDELSTSDVVTAVIPVGESGLMFDGELDGAHQDCIISGDTISNCEGVRLRGMIVEKRSYDAKDQVSLADAAAEDLRNAYKPIESLSVKAVDLHKIDPTVKPLRLYDWVRVTAKPYGIDQWMMVVKMDVDLMNPASCSYVLGSTKPTLTNSNVVMQRNLQIEIGDGIQKVTALTEEAKASAKEAIEIGEDAKDNADEKRRVFASIPFPPYDIGDLWVTSDDGKRTIRVCETAKGKDGDYAPEDWGLAATDNTVADEAKSVANAAADTVGTAVKAAESAIEAAETAQNAAQEAIAAADNASKVATDYIEPVDDGFSLKVGDSSALVVTEDASGVQKMEFGIQSAEDAIKRLPSGWSSGWWTYPLEGEIGGRIGGASSFTYARVELHDDGCEYVYGITSSINAGDFNLQVENPILQFIVKPDGEVCSADGEPQHDYFRTYTETDSSYIYTIESSQPPKQLTLSGPYRDKEPKASKIQLRGALIDGNLTVRGDLYVDGVVKCPWPIGSVIHMVSGTNPNDFYPETTWERMEGRFLLGSTGGNALGGKGGEEKHTLVVSEMPPHNHTVSEVVNHTHTTSNYLSAAEASGYGLTPGGGFTNRVVVERPGNQPVSKDRITGGSGGHTHITNNTGGGQAHNNMPPYEVVNMWKRVA